MGTREPSALLAQFVSFIRFQRPPEALPKQDHKNSTDRANRGVQRPELEGSHSLVEAAHPADQAVRNKQAQKADSHHRGVYFSGRGS